VYTVLNNDPTQVTYELQVLYDFTYFTWKKVTKYTKSFHTLNKTETRLKHE